jgi:DNA-binding NarL/FixJ family response regulator
MVMATDRVRVMLVDDHAIARYGIRLMLELNAIEVVCEAATAAQALELFAAHSLDVAIVDISLPGMSGLDLLRALRAQKPEVAVLILTTHPEESYAIRTLRNGAAGYLTKDVLPDMLAVAVRKVAAGRRHFSAALGDQLVTQLQGGSLAGHEALSKRELQVMTLLAVGQSVGAIGASLLLSPKTVSTYRTRIFEKIGAHNNAELTRYAMEEGLI